MNKHPIFDFIAKNSPHLKWAQDRSVLIVRSGSMAYGTNTPSSDEDIKGIMIPPVEYFLGSLHRIEQIELKNPNPDCVIYDIRKCFDLAIGANPNIIEMLNVDPSDQIIVDPIGEIIMDHSKEFLSKKIKHTFLGYSVSQLKRIKLHKSWLMHPVKTYPTRSELGLPQETLIPQDQLMAAEAEIKKELNRYQFDFLEDLQESQKIGIQSIMTEMLAELKISSEDHWMAVSRKIGLSDNFIEVMKKERQYTSAKRAFEQYQNWKENRNKDRATLEEKYGYDTKHAYHLVRLIRMCREILTTGKVIVKRPDREELLAIRNGAWTYEELIDFAEREEQELNVIYETCNVLPNKPDREKLDQLCIKLVEKSLSKYSWYNVKKQLDKLFRR